MDLVYAELVFQQWGRGQPYKASPWCPDHCQKCLHWRWWSYIGESGMSFGSHKEGKCMKPSEPCHIHSFGVETLFKYQNNEQNFCRFEICRYLKLPMVKLRLISWEQVTYVYNARARCWMTKHCVVIGNQTMNMHTQRCRWGMVGLGERGVSK